MLQIRLSLLIRKVNSHYSKQKVASSTSNTKVDKDGNKSKKKGKCKYCREPGHYVKECPKLKEKEAKKKEAGMAVVADAAHAKIDFANMVHDAEWAFIVECNFDSSAHDACMIVAYLDVWYFDSGASKHITSHCDLFSSHETVPVGNSVMCANDSS